MNKRIIAIGDIHGHAKALSDLVGLIDVQPSDTLVTLGDYVDCGPDAKNVLNQLIELQKRCNFIALMGNHEEMMLGAWEGRDNFEFWMQFGGDATLKSYGSAQAMNLIPHRHGDFLKNLKLYHETEHHFFIHANYFPNRPIDRQDRQTALWRPLTGRDIPGRHYSQKVAIVGHTPTTNRAILDLGHLKCIDTGCGYGGLLTALDVMTGKVWQVAENGTTPRGARAGIEREGTSN
jgi:serine/threonine protein phosphatase 1